MRYQINATLLVSGEVEAPSEEIAWDRFRQRSMDLSRVQDKDNVTNFTVEEAQQDEIDLLDDELEDDDEAEGESL